MFSNLSRLPISIILITVMSHYINGFTVLTPKDSRVGILFNSMDIKKFDV